MFILSLAHYIDNRLPLVLNKQSEVPTVCFSPKLKQSMEKMKTGLTSFEPKSKYRPAFFSFINSSARAKSECRRYEFY